MQYLLSIATLLILASCSEQEVQLKPPISIDWEEELFGVGFCGTNPDSLNSVWIYYKVNPNSVVQQKTKSELRAKGPAVIENDKITISNYFYRQEIGIVEDRIRLREFLLDSTTSRIEWSSNGMIMLTKLDGDSLIPNKMYIKMSSKELRPNFQNLDFNTGFANAKFNYRVSLFKDTALVVAKRFSIRVNEQSLVIPNQKDLEFLHMFANTLVEKRNVASQSNIMCTYGYMYSMNLRYDSLEFNYDNLCTNKVVPDYVHSYFSNTIDSTQLIPTKKDFDDNHYIYDAVKERGFKGFEKGNDIGDYPTPPPPEEPIIITDE